MSKLTRNNSALLTAAARIGVSPDALFAVIMHESRGNPTIKNPYSSARGLIQFTDGPARDLGYASSADLIAKHPTIEGQLLGPIPAYYAYVARYTKTRITDANLPLATFYPAYINKPLDTAFPSSVPRSNPGIHTPRDYVTRVYKSGQYGGIRAADTGKLAAAAAAVGIFFCSIAGILSDNTAGGGAGKNGKTDGEYQYFDSAHLQNCRCGCKYCTQDQDAAIDAP
jgi:hypothetical protein